MNAYRNKWSHPVSALCIGLGVGAVLGILFAHQAGKKTREDIAGTVTDGVDEIRARTAKAIRGAQQFASQARGQVEDALEAGTEAYREGMRSAG